MPNTLSIDRKTNEKIVGIVSADFPLFSRNEPLHLLLDVLSVSDEEDELLSSIPCKEYISSYRKSLQKMAT